MNTTKKILLTVLLVPILLILVALFLPSRYQVTRSLDIKAAPDAIFTNLNTLTTWPEWTAWTVAKYPDMKITFAGPPAGVGASYTWDGSSTGYGTLRLTRSEQGKGVGFDLDFDHGKYLSKGSITLTPSGDATTVTWVNEGDLGWNPVSRYFGLLMDRMMGPDFAEGLMKLQKRVEVKPVQP